MNDRSFEMVVLFFLSSPVWLIEGYGFMHNIVLYRCRIFFPR